MNRLVSTAAMTLALLMAPATVGAHPFIVDQHNDGFVPPFYQNIQLLGPMGQEFTPSLASLDVVELHTADMVSNDGGAALQLNIRALTIFGAILGTSLVVPLADSFFGVTRGSLVSVLRSLMRVAVVAAAKSGSERTDLHQAFREFTRGCKGSRQSEKGWRGCPHGTRRGAQMFVSEFDPEHVWVFGKSCG